TWPSVFAVVSVICSCQQSCFTHLRGRCWVHTFVASWSVRPCRRTQPATGRRWRLFVYLLNGIEHRFRVDGSGQFFGLSIRSVANEGIVAAEFFHQRDQFCRLLI